MTGTFAAWSRKVLIVFIAIVGCMALFLAASAAVKAEQIEASWYGPGFEGATTASGDPFDPYGYTAASLTYDFGTRLIVTYEGRSAVVEVNDRGPYIDGRGLDLSQGAAEYLGLTAVGVGAVNVEVAAPSTPTGPYGGTKEVRRQAFAPQDAQQSDEPAQNTAQQPAENEQAEPGLPVGTGQQEARQDLAGIGEDQYASEDQYKNEVVVKEAVPPAPPAPKPAVPVLPPEPEPAALETPPVELAVPNSTIERRVELNVAAPVAASPAPKPAEQPVEAAVAQENAKPVAQEASKPAVQEAPEPVVEEDPEPVVEEKPKSEKPESKESEATGPGGITVLPETGGAPLGAIVLLGGSVLLGAGIMVKMVLR